MSPTNHVGRRLLPLIFIPNIDDNRSASRIIALTFPTKSVSNESTFIVQRAHSYRAFLRNHIRTNHTDPTSLRVPTFPTVPTAPTSSPSGGSHSTGSDNQRIVCIPCVYTSRITQLLSWFAITNKSAQGKYQLSCYCSCHSISLPCSLYL